MTQILLLALAGTFRFSGGLEQTLAEEASLQLKRPIVMLAVSSEARRAFRFLYDTDLRRLMRVNAGFEITPAGGLFPPAWPSGVGRVWYEQRYQRQFEPFRSGVRFKDGRITLKTREKEAATLSDIARLGLTRPLVWSNFYDRARLRLSVKGATESEFLAALADALGTRLVEEKAAFRLVTDPKQYRSRALAMWRAIGQEGEREQDPVRMTDAAYMTTLLPLTGDWMIRHGIDDPQREIGQYADHWAPDTPVHKAAWARAQAGFDDDSSAVKGLLRRIARPGDPLYSYIDATGEPKVGFRNPETHEIVVL